MPVHFACPFLTPKHSRAYCPVVRCYILLNMRKQAINMRREKWSEESLQASRNYQKKLGHERFYRRLRQQAGLPPSVGQEPMDGGPGGDDWKEPKDAEEDVLLLNFIYRKTIGRFDFGIQGHLMKKPSPPQTRDHSQDESGRKIAYIEQDLRRFPSSKAAKSQHVTQAPVLIAIFYFLQTLFKVY